MTIEILNLIKRAEAKVKVPMIVPSTGECIGYEEKYPFPELSEHQQLELLKVLIEGRWIEFAHYRKGDLGSKSYYAGTVNFKNRFEAETFDETLAGIVNLLWSSMNNEDKNKIKKILGG
jgi:hypothetical protein